MARLILTLIAVCSCLLHGCAGGTRVTEGPLSKLPSATVADNMFIVEIGFANVEIGAGDLPEEYWLELDELTVEPARRAALLANGLRCGVAGEQLPEVLRTAVDETIATDRHHQIRRLQVRAGHRTEVVTTDRDLAMTVLINQPESTTGHQFEDAQGVLALQFEPALGPRARIELVPEVHYGKARQRYIGQDGAFVLQSARDTRVFHDLASNLVMAPGQTLVLTATGPDKSLGGNLFRSEEGWQKILLIRLARAQQEQLFDDSLYSESL